MRVLILAYDFPPYVSVGGLRPYSWYRYLKEFGVEPVVVTRQWANDFRDERDYVAPTPTDRIEVERTEHGTILRTPSRPILSHRLLLRHGPGRYRLLRKLITAGYEAGQYYVNVGPKKPLYDAARRYIREHGADVIMATGNPFVLFRYAARLSREFAIPWVADYRDPWSQDKRRQIYRVSRPWVAALERRYVTSASAITTVADSVRDLLAGLHPRTQISVVLNGYDPEAMAAARGIEPPRAPLTLAFTGSIYGWHPVESVFSQLDAHNAAHVDGPVHLMMVGVAGRDEIEGTLRARFPALAARTTFTARLSNDRMAAEVARAHAFLMFNNYAYPGTKIFDYLALQRRILLCYADDPEARALKARYYNIDEPSGADDRVLERIVEATRSGVVVRDAPHLRRVLDALQRELAEEGSIVCDTGDIEEYSRRTQAGRLAAILREVAR